MLAVDYDKGTVSDKFAALCEHLYNLHVQFLQSIYLSYIVYVIQMQHVHITRTFKCDDVMT